MQARSLFVSLFLVGACQKPAPAPPAPLPPPAASASATPTASTSAPTPAPVVSANFVPETPPPPPPVFPALPASADIPKAPEGAARRLEATNVKGSIPDLLTAWKDLAATSNWFVEAQYRGRVSSWIVFAHASGARAYGVLQGSGPFTASLSIVPKPRQRERVPMPGACVPIPSKRQSAGGVTMEVHSNGQAELHGAGSTFETNFERDLDGDGFPDALVPLGKGKQCPEEIQFAVYITRGDCGHHVGFVGPGEQLDDDFEAAPDPRGLKPLTYVVSLNPSRLGADKRTTRVFRFSGNAYGVASFRSEEASCSHCPTWLDGCTDVEDL